jgi:hypothetical protein
MPEPPPVMKIVFPFRFIVFLLESFDRQIEMNLGMSCVKLIGLAIPSFSFLSLPPSISASTATPSCAD